MRDGAEGETTPQSRGGGPLPTDQISARLIGPRSRAKASNRGIGMVVVAAALACAMLASCTDPIGQAEERRQSVYDHGGTNREICAEARKAKAAYVDAGRHDDAAWLAVDIHCANVDGPSGDMVAKQHSDAIMAGGR